MLSIMMILTSRQTGFLHNGPRDDGILPQVRRVLPGHGRHQGLPHSISTYGVLTLFRMSELKMASTMQLTSRSATAWTMNHTRACLSQLVIDFHSGHG